MLTADAQAIETRHLGFTISPHEECGVEEAVRLVEANGGESVVLTLGPAEAEEQLRDAMAIGVDRAIHLETDERGVGRRRRRRRRSSTRSAPTRPHGPFDLIVFGNESADSGNYQVGIRVAHALGRPVATGLKGVAVEDGAVRCEQEAAGGRDVYVAAAARRRDRARGAQPARATRRSRAAAREDEAGRTHARRRGPPRGSRSVRLVVPEGEGKQAEVLGDGPDAAPRGRRGPARDRGAR